MTNHDHITLTASELSYLWNTCMADSMTSCVLEYFLNHTEDPDTREIVTVALRFSKQHVERITNLFMKEGIQPPKGFTEEDVNLEANRLFSDVFYLKYIKNMANGGFVTYGRILQSIVRSDVCSIFTTFLTDTIELNRMVTDTLLEKGINLRPPAIPYPKSIEFIKKQSFMLEGLGRRSQLTGTEITNLFMNIETNQLGTCLATGFAQVAKKKEVRKFFQRGREISIKHIEVFKSYLENNELPIPMSFEHEVTESVESPFSDKLMLFHFSLMIYAGIGNYGVAISESRRSDLVLDYARVQTEILKFAEDGVNLLIENEWLEQFPLSIDRNKIIQRKHTD